MPARIWISGCVGQAGHLNWCASLLESAASLDFTIAGPGNRWIEGPERMVIASRKERLARDEACAYCETGTFKAGVSSSQLHAWPVNCIPRIGALGSHLPACRAPLSQGGISAPLVDFGRRPGAEDVPGTLEDAPRCSKTPPRRPLRRPRPPQDAPRRHLDDF